MSAGPRAFDACPACMAAPARWRRLYRMPGAAATEVAECGACGLVFKTTHPVAGGLGLLYDEAYVHFSEPPRLGPAELLSARWKLRAGARRVAPRAGPLRLLDIGCGAGQFVAVARDEGFLAEGIDPFLPDRLARPPLRRASPEDWPAESVDLAVMLNVAEHVVAPRALFASVRRLLAPGGALLVTCPHGGSWARRAFGPRWCHMALEEHLLFWTPASLARSLRDAGFAGPWSCRIAGSPFPFGRVPDPVDTVPVAPDAPPAPAASASSPAWSLARRLQSSAFAGGVLRRLIQASRLGDYLEFVIARDPLARAAGAR